MQRLMKIIDSEYFFNEGKQSKLSLIKEKETLQSILNSLDEGVIIANKNGKFLFFNPVAKKILGIGLKNVKAEEWSKTYGCYYPDKVNPYPSEELPLARALRNEEVIDEKMFIKNPKRSTGVYINVSAAPIKDEQGLVSGGAVIFRDVS